MAQILAIVLEILGLMGTITTAINQILGIVGTTAQEHAKFAIEKIAANTANTVNSPTFGNAALLAAILAAKDQEIADTAAILVAVGDAQQSGSPVTLPTTPPAGYGGGSGSSAADIWAYPSALTGTPANDRLDNGSLFVLNLATMAASFPIATNPYFMVRGVWWSAYGTNSAGSDPKFSTAAILRADTLSTFLERESGYTGWTRSSDGYYSVHQDSSGSPFDYVCVLNQTTFRALQDQLFQTISASLPPTWPGIDAVTLGTPVDILPQLTVTEFMHGVIVAITSVTTNKPQLAYDSELAYKFIGALAFVNDDGWVEPFQPLAFSNALYCPRQMTDAAAVVVRADPSVVGTITPWVVTF